MGLITKIEQIAQTACPTCRFAYDVRALQNVRADDRHFPLIWVDEYYSGRVAVRQYGQWMREATVDVHFIDLVQMQDDGRENDRVRETLLPLVYAFIDALNADGTFGEVVEYQCDPEPPMFDAGATGWLVRVTLSYPACTVFSEPNTEEER